MKVILGILILLYNITLYGQSLSETEFRKVIDYSTKILNEDPKNILYLEARAEAYSGLGEYKKAITDYDHILSIDSFSVSALYGKATSYYYLGKYKFSINAYKKVLESQPKNFDSYLGLANSYVNIGNNEKAIDAYSKLLEIEENGETYYSRGIVLKKMSLLDEAINDLTHALSFGFVNCDVYSMRGEAYLENKQYKKAVSDFERALILCPDDNKLKSLLLKGKKGL